MTHSNNGPGIWVEFSDEEKEIAAKKYLKNVHCLQQLGKWKSKQSRDFIIPQSEKQRATKWSTINTGKGEWNGYLHLQVVGFQSGASTIKISLVNSQEWKVNILCDPTIPLFLYVQSHWHSNPQIHAIHKWKRHLLFMIGKNVCHNGKQS